MRAVAAVVVAAVVASFSAIAQTQEPAALRFEAASIKPAAVFEPGVDNFGPRGLDLFSQPASTLQQLLSYAYELSAYRIVGGPAWVTSDRFRVLAKANGVPTRVQMRNLVRQLLEERFQLRTHRETRELPIYNLVFSRGDHRPGPGLRAAPVDCRLFRSGQRPMSESPTIERPDGRIIPRCGFVTTWDMRTGATTRLQNGIAMEEFVAFLQDAAGRDVHDQTGLAGVFDFDLTFVPPNPVDLPGLPRPNGEGPALTTALPEQLGLKLEPSRGPVDLLVIDVAQRPTPD